MLFLFYYYLNEQYVKILLPDMLNVGKYGASGFVLFTLSFQPSQPTSELSVRLRSCCVAAEVWEATAARRIRRRRRGGVELHCHSDFISFEIQRASICSTGNKSSIKNTSNTHLRVAACPAEDDTQLRQGQGSQ